MKKRCIIICAYNEGSIRAAAPVDGGFVICADGGLDLARAEGITPDLIVGDFDSRPAPSDAGCPVVALPREKDDTDTLYALKCALERGYDEVIIVGGIGGRLDQTLANIQTLAFARNNGARALLCDGRNTARLLRDESCVFTHSECRYLSVFAYTESCRVTLSGVKYPLNDALLTNAFPLGVSNEPTADTARVSVSEGEALVITTCLT